MTFRKKIVRKYLPLVGNSSNTSSSSRRPRVTAFFATSAVILFFGKKAESLRKCYFENWKCQSEQYPVVNFFLLENSKKIHKMLNSVKSYFVSVYPVTLNNKAVKSGKFKITSWHDILYNWKLLSYPEGKRTVL